MHTTDRISALQDGAGDASDLTALASVTEDSELRDVWQRYQLIGEVIRGEYSGAESTMLRARVQSAIAAEPSLVTSRVVPLPQRPRFTARSPLRWAAAAGVLVAIFLSWSARQSAPVPGALQASSTSPALPAAVADAPRDGEQVSSLPPAEYQRRINRYLVNFNEQRAQIGVSGVHPHVRVVGLEAVPVQ